MKIAVAADIRFEEIDNFRELSVTTELTVDDLDRRLRESGLGYAKAGYAWLKAEALREQAGRLSTDDSWGTGFDEMIAYARSKRWWDDASLSVRAHISDHRDS